MPEIRRQTWFFLPVALDSPAVEQVLFKALITQEQLQKQLCAALKIVAGVFTRRIIR